MMKKLILLWILMLTIPLAYSAAYGRCNYNEYYYDKGCRPAPPPPGRGGGSGSITVGETFSEVSLFGEPSFGGNGSCKEGYQLFDGRCYACDPKIGYLEFNPNDRSVICVKCIHPYGLVNGTCVKLSEDFKFPKNQFKYIILAITLLVGMYSLYPWLSKRETEEDKQPREKPWLLRKEKEEKPDADADEDDEES